MNARTENIDAIIRRRRMILFAGFVAHMEDTMRLPMMGVMSGKRNDGRGGLREGEKQTVDGRMSWTTSELSVSTPTS